MTTEEKYLTLLRKACFGVRPEGAVSLSSGAEEPVHVEENEWQELFHLCQIHGTGPLIYNELLKGECPMAMQMKQACMQNMMLQSAWENLIAKTWHALQEGGVHAVLMKGFAYARLYPLPYLRSWGDLDVWVGPEQYHRACGLLREAFPEAKHHDEEWDELKHYCFVFPSGMAIELHRVSMDFLSAKDQAYWCQLEKEQTEGRTMEVGGVNVPLFDANFDLLFCFMHSWEHFTGSGIPLKQVADMALLVKDPFPTGGAGTLSLPTRGTITSCAPKGARDIYLEKHLRALGMLEVWRSYGYMACKAMGMELREWPLLIEEGQTDVSKRVRKYGERLYQQVMQEGQCRRKDYGEAGNRYAARDQARQMHILARKWLTLTQRVEKSRFMHRFAPRYARYVLWQEVKKGIRRTLRREEMINY